MRFFRKNKKVVNQNDVERYQYISPREGLYIFEKFYIYKGVKFQGRVTEIHDMQAGVTVTDVLGETLIKKGTISSLVRFSEDYDLLDLLAPEFPEVFIAAKGAKWEQAGILRVYRSLISYAKTKNEIIELEGRFLVDNFPLMVQYFARISDFRCITSWTLTDEHVLNNRSVLPPYMWQWLFDNYRAAYKNKIIPENVTEDCYPVFSITENGTVLCSLQHSTDNLAGIWGTVTN